MVLADVHWGYGPCLLAGGPADDVDLCGPNHRGCDHGREDGARKGHQEIHRDRDVRRDRGHVRTGRVGLDDQREKGGGGGGVELVL